jgi:hypothetical protein
MGVMIKAPISKKTWLGVDEAAAQSVIRKGTTSGKIAVARPPMPRTNRTSPRAKGRMSERPPIAHIGAVEAARNRAQISAIRAHIGTKKLTRSMRSGDSDSVIEETRPPLARTRSFLGVSVQDSL